MSLGAFVLGVLNGLTIGLLAVGLVLRVATQIAYRPALFYIDSMKYLFGAYPGNDPPGYQILIRPLLAVADPSFLAGLQHVLGLAMAVVPLRWRFRLVGPSCLPT